MASVSDASHVSTSLAGRSVTTGLAIPSRGMACRFSRSRPRDHRRERDAGSDAARIASTSMTSSPALGTNLQRGLTDSEAQSRLEQHGRNELAAEKPVPAWRRFLAQFQDVLVILLLVATAISAGLVGLRAGRAAAIRGDRHLRGRPAQRHHGLRPGVAGRGGRRGPSRDVGRRCHGHPGRRPAEHPGRGYRSRRHHSH